MKNGKKLSACLAALVFAFAAFVLSACQPQAAENSSGGAPSGGAEMNEEELEEALLQAFESDEISGLRGTRHEKRWQSREYSEFYSETTAARDEDGVFGADLYRTERRGTGEPGSDAVEWGGPPYTSAAFFRDIDFYDGDLGEVYTLSEEGSAETDLMQENIAALQEYIADGEDVLFRRESATRRFERLAGETRQDFLAACGVIADAFGQMFALFDGEAAAADGGYTLTYNLRDCAEELYEGVIKDFLREMDEDPDMSWADFAELPQVIALSNRLFADADAEDMHVFLRVAVKAFLTWAYNVSADAIEAADLGAILPAPGKTQSGAGYLRACLARLPEIVKEIAGKFENEIGFVGDQIDSVTPYKAVSFVLPHLGGDLGDSLEANFASLYEGLSVYWEKYGREAVLVFRFDAAKRLAGVDLCIDFDAREASDMPETVLNLSYRLDFLYEPPALFDLAGYRCCAGEKLKDGVYEGEIELSGHTLETGAPVGAALGVGISLADGKMTISLSDGDDVLWTGVMSVSGAGGVTGMLFPAEFTWRGERFDLWVDVRGVLGSAVLAQIIDSFPFIGVFGYHLCLYLGIPTGGISVESVYLEIEQIGWQAAEYAPVSWEAALDTEPITEYIR